MKHEAPTLWITKLNALNAKLRLRDLDRPLRHPERPEMTMCPVFYLAATGKYRKDQGKPFICPN